MRAWAGGLWARPDFLKLWAGQTVSQVGSQVTALALPLLAVTLGATPTQMGALIAIETVPFLALSLLAGMWIDRLRRRPILIATDLGRAALLASLPVAALLGRLGLPQIYLVAVGVGTLTVFFDLAYQAYLPVLVGRAHLVEGNSKLELSRAAAQIAGPGLAGVLVQLLAAPRTIALDALSFLLSACCLRAIEAPEAVPVAARRGGRAEIGEGLRFVLGEPYLRAIVGCSATLNGFAFLQAAVYLLRATRELALPPGAIGLVSAAGGVGALVGAFASPHLVRRYGLGRTLIAGAAA